MIDKNLFAQDRKPPSPEAGVSSSRREKSAMGLGNLQLDGVMIRGNSKKALLRLKAQAAPGAPKGNRKPFITVQEGQQVGDFRVVRIEPKSVLLEKEGQMYTIDLFAAGKVVTPAAIPPPVAQPQEDAARGEQNHPGAVPRGARGEDRRPQPGGEIPGQVAPRQDSGPAEAPEQMEADPEVVEEDVIPEGEEE